MKRIMILLIIVGVLSSHFSTELVNAAKNNSYNGSNDFSTWIWKTEDIVNKSDEILLFLQQQNISLVYLQVNADIQKKDYQRFIKDAGKRGIKVFALGGSPKWLNSPNSMLQFFNWIKEYQKIASSEEQFVGVQLDIEPYLLPEWKKRYQDTVYKYQKTIMNATIHAKSLNLPLDIATPFWFDGYDFKNNQYGKGILSEWVTKKVDRITLMVYRDRLDGNNGVIQLSKNEIEYANKLRKKVTIAVETKKLDQDYLTFSEEGKNVLNQAINKIDKTYDKYNNFGGVAVHSYLDWKSLKN